MNTFEQALNGHVSGIRLAFKRHDKNTDKRLRYVLQPYEVDTG